MKKFLLVVLVVAVLSLGYFGLKFSRGVAPKDTSYDPGYISTKHTIEQSDVQGVPKVVASPLLSDPTNKEEITVLYALKHTLSQISWGKEVPDSLAIGGKTYQGTSMQGSYQSPTAGVTDFGEKGSLLSDGWSVDNELAAGGANGNAWGYTMDAEGGKQLLYFSYTNVSFTPPPGETKCPCAFQVKVFHFDSM
jgi:hypothetical protein